MFRVYVRGLVISEAPMAAASVQIAAGVQTSDFRVHRSNPGT